MSRPRTKTQRVASLFTTVRVWTLIKGQEAEREERHHAAAQVDACAHVAAHCTEQRRFYAGIIDESRIAQALLGYSDES